MNIWGNSSGVRALLLKSQALGRIAGKIQRLWTGEMLSDFKNNDLAELLEEQDTAAANVRTSRLKHEMTETYVLQRDSDYSTRSRKWLYVRGMQTQLDGYYEQWRRYALLTSDVKVTQTLPKVDEKALPKISYPTLMGDQIKS